MNRLRASLFRRPLQRLRQTGTLVRCAAAVAVGLAAFGAAPAHAQSAYEGDMVFRKAQFEALSFQSAACTGFWKTPSFSCRAITVPVYLARAKSGDSKALVLISHGTGGLDRRHGDYAEYLAANGINALVVDSWTARDIVKISYDYAAGKAKGADAFNQAIDASAIIASLRAMPEWKDAKFGHMGESMGASAAVNSVRPFMPQVVQDATGRPGSNPDAAVALYAGCIDQVEGDFFKPIPLLYVTGEKDDNTPAATCVRKAKWMNGRGATAEVVVLPGEAHDFDAPWKLWYNGRADNPAKCSHEAARGQYTLFETGKTYPQTPDGYKAMWSDCVTKGTSNGHRSDPKTGYTVWKDYLVRKLLAGS